MTNANERQIRTTNGYFDVVGEIIIDAKTFTLGQPGKNNQNWIQNIFNPKIEADNGKSMYMRFSSGYDAVKGKTIYARSKSETNLEVAFGDRNNENIVSLIDEKSFIRVGIAKELVKDEATGKEFKQWTYKNFLDTFDVVAFLQQVMPLASKQKVRITGTVKFSTYNGEVQRNYDIQSIYLLNGNEDEGKEMQPKLEFTQNVLLTKGCVVNELDQENGVATINALVMIKEKKEFKTVPVKFLMKPHDEKSRETYKKLIPMLFEVAEDKVRKIALECIFEVGYVSGSVNEEDLPQEAKELLDMGLYSMEEVMKMYAVRERVDNLLIKRPKMKIVDGKPSVEMNDTEYLPSDLEGKGAEVVQEEVVGGSENIDSLLDDLNNL
jgi:hypothetical protein